MVRLFVGLRPPQAIRRQLLGVMGGIPGARWQDDAQLHITLRFIGEVERPVAEDVAAALDAAIAPPIEIALSGVGQFDSHGRPNAVWAGVAPHAPLAALHRKVDQAIVRTGLPSERRAYLPHITLARLNATAGATDNFLRDSAGLSSEPFVIDHFLLYQSHLGSEGARYEAVARYALR